MKVWEITSPAQLKSFDLIQSSFKASTTASVHYYSSHNADYIQNGATEVGLNHNRLRLMQRCSSETSGGWFLGQRKPGRRTCNSNIRRHFYNT